MCDEPSENSSAPYTEQKTSNTLHQTPFPRSVDLPFISSQ